MVAVFGWTRSAALYGAISRIADYLIEIEKSYACEPLAGWERYLANIRKTSNTGEMTMGRSSQLFWRGLTIVTVLLGLTYTFGHWLGWVPL
jgi:hypothetical protein